MDCVLAAILNGKAHNNDRERGREKDEAKYINIDRIDAFIVFAVRLMCENFAIKIYLL